MAFSNLRFLAVFAVIILHVATIFVQQGFQNSEFDMNWWVANILDSLVRWCVPVFVIVSGYFLLDRTEDTKTFIDKRVKKIIIPLVFWSIFYVAWLCFVKIYSGTEITVKTIIGPFISGKPYYHLWYIYMIPFLYMVTPYLRILFKNITKGEFKFLLLLFFAYAIFNQFSGFYINPRRYYIFINSFMLYLGYYAFGGYLKIYGIPKTNSFLLLFLFSLSTLITVFGVFFLKNEYFYWNLSPTVVIQSISALLLIIKYFNFDIFGKTEILAYYSFGVYLVHAFFIDIFRFLINPESMSSFIYIPVVSILVLIASYLSCLIIGKIKLVNKII